MADRLEDLLRACTVRVTGSRGSGAGFFVAPGVILTCAHIVKGSADLAVHWARDGQQSGKARVSGPVTILPTRGRPIPALDDDYPDVALLEVSGLASHPCVRIDLGWPDAGDACQAFGFPEEGGNVQLTPVSLVYRGTKGVQPTAFLDLGGGRPGLRCTLTGPLTAALPCATSRGPGRAAVRLPCRRLSLMT